VDKIDKVNDAATVAFGLAVTGLFGPACIALMAAGAWRMLRGRSYLLCVVAALLAVLPWSPAWLLGLPIGVWALSVLGRPEVMATFLQAPRRAPPAPARNPAPRPAAGKVRGLWRSVVGYFFTTSPKARAP